MNDVVRLLVLSSALKIALRFLPTGWMMNSGSQIRVFEYINGASLKAMADIKVSRIYFISFNQLGRMKT